MGLLVRMLDRHEPDIVDQVILGLGWRISNVLLSWRRHVHRLVAVLGGIPERGWWQTKASYRRRGELIRVRLVELNGGVPLFASGFLLEGDRMLRFVQGMVLPWGADAATAGADADAVGGGGAGALGSRCDRLRGSSGMSTMRCRSTWRRRKWRGRSSGRVPSVRTRALS